MYTEISLPLCPKANNMKNFVTVIQTQANKFDVFFFNGESQSRLYPQTRLLGITVHIAETSKANDQYAFYLAEKMNNGI